MNIKTVLRLVCVLIMAVSMCGFIPAAMSEAKNTPAEPSQWIDGTPQLLDLYRDFNCNHQNQKYDDGRVGGCRSIVSVRQP